MPEEITYPIAETFHSVQGEGVYSGVPMKFIRLAGCNVGVYESRKATEMVAFEEDLFKIYPNGKPHGERQFVDGGKMPKYSICTTVDGQQFVCDTDYQKSEQLSLDDLFSDVREGHICVTGGEPFLHDLVHIARRAAVDNIQVHIETSGTRSFVPLIDRHGLHNVWITCSPKKGFHRPNMKFVSEWKFVVGEKFDVEYLENFFGYPNGGPSAAASSSPIYLQCLNGIDKVNRESLDRVMKILESRPEFRLSVQLHKFLEVR